MPFIDYKETPPEKRCTHPEHDPPKHMVYQPGTYTYKCPACGKITRFIVNGFTL